MRIIVIGGTGHVGTYLVPKLVALGHEVISISRQQSKPYHEHASWEQVRHIAMDRVKLEKTGEFSSKILALNPDVVIDMICFHLESAIQLADKLNGKINHFLHCGSIWIHGYSELLPTREEQSRKPFGIYGIQKAAIEDYFLEQYKKNEFPVTLIHPGHLVGPGWIPLNPAGNFNPQVFLKLKEGKPLQLPNLGMETVHHVHAEDVAGIFVQSILLREKALGQSFHAVSPQAMTLRGYAEEISEWFGQEADLRFLPWKDWEKTVSPEDAAATWDHIAHSPNCSMDKAARLLGFYPKHESPEAIKEAVSWLIRQNIC